MEGLDMKEIKKWLGKGGIQTLAKEHKLTPSQAYNILNGRSNNFKFLEAAIEKATDQKMRLMNGMRNLKARAEEFRTMA